MAGPQLELCSGTYRAQHAWGSIAVFGEGLHSTSGFHVFLIYDRQDPLSPEFSLWHLRPLGPVLQATTPFCVCAVIQTLHRVSRVFVRDATGRHEVPVIQPTAEAISLCG